MSNSRSQRSTAPVKPENSALADELRSQLKGKPTKSGFNRSAIREFGSFVWDIARVLIVVVLCVCFLSADSAQECSLVMPPPQNPCR